MGAFMRELLLCAPRLTRLDLSGCRAVDRYAIATIAECMDGPAGGCCLPLRWLALDGCASSLAQSRLQRPRRIAAQASDDTSSAQAEVNASANVNDGSTTANLGGYSYSYSGDGQQGPAVALGHPLAPLGRHAHRLYELGLGAFLHFDDTALGAALDGHDDRRGGGGGSSSRRGSGDNDSLSSSLRVLRLNSSRELRLILTADPAGPDPAPDAASESSTNGAPQLRMSMWRRLCRVVELDLSLCPRLAKAVYGSLLVDLPQLSRLSLQGCDTLGDTELISMLTAPQLQHQDRADRSTEGSVAAAAAALVSAQPALQEPAPLVVLMPAACKAMGMARAAMAATQTVAVEIVESC